MQIRDLKKQATLPNNETDHIIAYVIQKSREFVLAHPEFKLSQRQNLKITDFLHRRANGEPLAYILGFKEFYGLKFHTNNVALIPRPETELMVEEALAIFKGKAQSVKIQIIDIGTGSGCIAVALAYRLKHELKTLNHKIIASDIEPKAIKLARKNAQLNQVKDLIDFKTGNLLEPVVKYCYTLHDVHYMICANLPYLTPSQVKNSATIQYEPKTALISGTDGLQHYRELFKQIKSYKISNYQLLCEIDDTQAISMTDLIKQELPKANFEIKKDLGGYDRLAIIKN